MSKRGLVNTYSYTEYLSKTDKLGPNLCNTKLVVELDGQLSEITNYHVELYNTVFMARCYTITLKQTSSSGEISCITKKFRKLNQVVDWRTSNRIKYASLLKFKSSKCFKS